MRGWIRRQAYQIIRYLVDRRDRQSRVNTTFPTAQGHNYLVEPLFPDAAGAGFYTKFYAEDAENPVAIDYKRYKTEIVAGTLGKAGQWHDVNVDGASALPYSITNAN